MSTYEIKCPPKCTLCIDAYLTGSLYESMKIDPRRCIGFNHWTTQEKEDSYVGAAWGYISPEIREKNGDLDLRLRCLSGSMPLKPEKTKGAATTKRVLGQDSRRF